MPPDHRISRLAIVALSNRILPAMLLANGCPLPTRCYKSKPLLPESVTDGKMVY
jgi:hypothetical protein